MKKTIGPRYELGIVLSAVLLFITIKCTGQTRQTAQYDTIPCRVSCIQKFVSKPTKSGNERIYAIYLDKQQGISDIISVSKSVYEYITTCKQYDIVPALGIKLRNGQISSIIKYKKKYKRF